MAKFDSLLTGFRGGFTDGRFGSFVPYFNNRDPIKFPNLTADYHGKFVRVDLENFTEALTNRNSGVITVLDLTKVNENLRGFELGFCTDRYAFLSPNKNNSSGYLARVDLQNFTLSGVSYKNMTDYDNDLIGFTGGVQKGKFAYISPSNLSNGKVVRICCQ